MPADVLSNTLRYIKPLIAQSVSMRIQGKSSPKGRHPEWLVAASDVRFVDLDGNDQTVLYFEAPQLGDAAATVYRQQMLWNSRPDPHQTGFDLLTEALNDVTQHNQESEKFDLQLLARVERFGKSLQESFQEVVIEGHDATATTHPLTLIRDAEQLRHLTPRPQKARVAGKLDMVRLSTDRFAIQLDDGKEVAAVVSGETIDTVISLLGKRVVVTGNAIFRPSGSLLRVDAEAVFAGENESSFWSRVPQPQTLPFAAASIRRNQGRRTGAAAIYGQWTDDDMSNDEFLKLLDELH